MNYLKNINNLHQLRDFLGTNAKAEYFRGKGRKVKGYTLNQLAFKLSKISFANTAENINLFNELKIKLRKLDQTSMRSLAQKAGRPKFELTLAKIRQKVGNCWFKIWTGFDRKQFLNSPLIPAPVSIPLTPIDSPQMPTERDPNDDPLDVVVEHTEPFSKYQIDFRGKPTSLTAFNLRPANLFFQSLFKGTSIRTTLPGEGLFEFLPSGKVIRQSIEKMVKENPEGIVQFSAKGVNGNVENVIINDFSEVYGDKVYQMTYKEIQDVLNSQKIYTSSFLPLRFYQKLKEALKKRGDPILPGSDKAPLTLLELKTGPLEEFLNEVDKDPLAYGFKTKKIYERFKQLNLYEIGSMVVKIEDYYLFADASGKIFTREAGEKNDAFRLINACGIRGIGASKTPDLMKRDIMKETFKTALYSAENGLVLFPAVGMGVWGGPPEIYWPAFLDAIVESPDQFDRIFVHPGHRETAIGSHVGKKGEEFQIFLDSYLQQYQDKPEILCKLKKIKNLLAENTDLLQLAHNLKMAFSDKTVSLFNASDPDVTLGWHVGEYTNNMPHGAPTTEEHYTALGTNGLCFEDITGVHEDPSRLIHVN